MNSGPLGRVPRPARLGFQVAVGVAVAGSLLHAIWQKPKSTEPGPPQGYRDTPPGAAPAEPDTHDPGDEQCVTRALHFPSGEPPKLSCADARRIVAQVRSRMADKSARASATQFAEGLVTWLDPHGLWSAAPDAPARQFATAHAQAMIAELEQSPHDPSPCSAARELGLKTGSWVTELRALFSDAVQHAPAAGRRKAWNALKRDLFEDDPVRTPARVLARELGKRAGVFARAYPSFGPSSADLARRRFFPDLTVEDWTGVVIAAALRSYVPSMDPHGSWAPLDEEWSLYAGDSASSGTAQLWERMTRTAVGVRVVEGAAPPLRDGDLVLEIGGVATAGMSVEQSEQLAVLESVGGETTREVRVLREGEATARALTVLLPDLDGHSDQPPALEVERVPYGDAELVVIELPDVPDSLGEELAELVANFDPKETPVGIVLDLRGNGGGSTDGAAGALGVFLPGVASFPLRRRDGAIEVEHTLSPPRSGQWDGPVAVLVDGYTASAAEMIAGGIASYHRGPVVGTRTFGKGCIQEYFDDRVGAGVLRLTTMVFALPDGSPLQGVGIAPTIPLGFSTAREREAVLPGALATWRGPDVRNRNVAAAPPWPHHRDQVGPCSEPALCRALRKLPRSTPAPRPYGTRLARAERRGNRQPKTSAQH